MKNDAVRKANLRLLFIMTALGLGMLYFGVHAPAAFLAAATLALYLFLFEYF